MRSPRPYPQRVPPGDDPAHRGTRRARRGSLPGPAGFVLAVVVSVGGAHWLRDYTLEQLTVLYDGRWAVLSPALRSDQELGAAYRAALANEDLCEQLEQAGPEAPGLIYVIPESWELADLPIPEGVRSPDQPRGHYTPTVFDRARYKLHITRALTHDPAARGAAILRKTWSPRRPPSGPCSAGRCRCSDESCPCSERASRGCPSTRCGFPCRSGRSR